MDLQLAPLVIPAASGLIGVVIGAWLSGRRDRSQRRLSFVEKQLSNFYSPMLGIREEIASGSILRMRIQEEAQKAWRDLNEQARMPGHPDTEWENREAEFDRILQFDSEKLTTELLPAYRRMANLFRDNYWLAEKDTRPFYLTVLTFVEIWERWMAKALPIEVWRRLDHSESHLFNFYDHLASSHDRLRAKLERGAA